MDRHRAGLTPRHRRMAIRTAIYGQNVSGRSALCCGSLRIVGCFSVAKIPSPTKASQAGLLSNGRARSRDPAMTKLLVLIVLMLWEAPGIYAQQAEDLRQQLDQLKQEYQRKI